MNKKLNKNKKNTKIDTKRQILSEILNISLLLIFIFLSSKAIFHEGFFRTIDDLTTVRLHYLYKELKHFNWFNFPVRMSGELSNGYGYPLYLYYASLTYYFGALMMFLGKSHIVATKFVYIFPLIFGPLFFYIACRQKLKRLPSLIASIFYTFFPYRGFDIFLRGGAPEAWAVSFIPLVFAGIFILEKKQWGGFLFSLGLFLAVFSHQLTGAQLIIFVLIYGILFMRKNKRFWFYFLLSFGLLAFYIFPMLFYIKIVRLTYIKENTQFILESLKPINKLFDFKIKFTQGDFFYPFDLYFIFISLIFIKWKNKWNLFWAFSGLILFLLIFEQSLNFWKITLPITGIFQFAWRNLTLLSFIIPFYLGQVVNQIKNNFFKLFLSILVVIYSLNFQSLFKPKEYSTFYEYKPEGKCAAVSHHNEFLPIWVKKCPSKSTFLDISSLAKIKIFKEEPLFLSGKITNQKPFYLVVNKYFFPGWQVFIDGKNKEIDYSFSPYGIFRFFIDKPGEHYIKIFYKKTLIMWISDLVSLFSWFIFLLLVIRK